MPDPQNATPTWNPVQEFHQQWPNSGLTDQQVLTNLQDPAKFRSAFPHYTGVTDDEIRTRMRSYAQPQTPSPTVGPSHVNQTWDRISNEYYPEALGAINKFLSTPISKYTSGTTFSEEAAKTASGSAPAAQGGWSGILADAKRFGVTLPAGLADFIQTPTGIAASFLEAATGGAATPWLAGAYTAQQGAEAYDQYRTYKQNPTPENLQNFLSSTALTAAIGAGGKAKVPSRMLPPLDLTGLKPSVAPPVEEPQSTLESIQKPVEHAAKAQTESTKAGIANELVAPSPSIAALGQDIEKLIAPKVESAPSTGTSTGQMMLGGRGVMEPVAPRKLGEGTSAVMLAEGEAPKTNDAQAIEDHKGEIDRLQGVLRNPSALPEEKAYAAKAIQASQDLLDQLPAPPILTDEKRAEISRAAAAQAEKARVASIPPEIAPEPTQELSPAHQQVATAVEDRHQSAPVETAPVAAPPPAAPTQLPEAPTPAQPAEPFVPRISPVLDRTFNTLVSLRHQLNSAVTDEEKSTIQGQLDQSIARAKGQVLSHIRSLDPDQLSQLRDHVNAIAQEHTQRADLVRQLDTLRNNNAANAEAAVRMKAAGGQARPMVIDEETGDRAVVKPESEYGPISRAILASGQGKEARLNVEDILSSVIRHPNPKPATIPNEEWTKHQDVVANLINRKINSVRRDIAALNNMHEESGGTSLVHIDDTDIPARLKEIDRDLKMLGKIPETKGGALKKVPVEVENGQVKAAPLQVPALADWRKILSPKLRTIPESKAAQAAANDLQELGRLHKAFGTAIDKQIGLKAVPKPELVRAGERGGVGEAPLASPYSSFFRNFKFPENKILQTRARAQGVEMRPVDDDHPPGSHGWLSADGKTWIRAGNAHDPVAAGILGRPNAPAGEATSVMLGNGWIRKAGPGIYQVGKLTPKVIDTLEMDLIRDGKHGQTIEIDEGEDVMRPRESHTIQGGYRDLARAIRQVKAGRYDLGEIGKVGEQGRVSGTEIMGGMAAGGAIGGAVGGFPGMAVGMGLGAVSPALLRSEPVMRAFRSISPIIHAAHILPRDWVMGPKDNPSISPVMQTIRDKQVQSMKAPEQTLAARISMIDGNIWHALDPFAFVSDRPNPAMRWTMAEDPRGLYFRNAKGKLSLDESPYVAARTAVSGIRGGVGVARMMYGAIEHDARQAGLHGETTDYLNLKGYQRTYQTLMEHARELLADTKNTQSALASAHGVREQIDLQDHIKANTDALTEIRDKLKNGTAVPGGYTPESIQRDLAALSNKLGPQKFAQVQDLAKRVFDSNRKALDLIADVQNSFKNGIISKDLYQKFVARGNEYIPMRRILETAAGENGRFYGKQSPLYLRQQNVIKAMEGSELVNTDPWQASADGHAEAIREYYRNRTLGTFLDAAHNDPDISQYFTPVTNDYKAKRGEIVVGHYAAGEQQRYSVPEWLGKSLDTTSLAQSQTALNVVLRATTKLFKDAATIYNPLWVATRQIPTVAGRALLTAEGPMDPKLIAKTFAQSVKSAWTHDDRWMEFAKTGLQRGTLMRMLYPEQDLSNLQLGWTGPFSKPTHVLETVRQLTDLPTDILTMNHWSRLRQAGYSPEAATWKTQHYGPLPDYAQMGRLDGPISVATTFLKADWAHIRSTLALATDKEYRGRLALAGVAVALPTLANALWNAQQTDEKGRPLWARVLDTDKERYWVTLTGGVDKDGRPNAIHIPKPDFVRIMFNPMEDMMYKGLSALYKNNADPRHMTQVVSNAASRFIPANPQFDTNRMTGPLSTAEEVGSKLGGSLAQQIIPGVRTPVEDFLNRQVQFGKIEPIVGDTNQVPAYQGYGRTNISPTAMSVGQKTGISPEHVEHFARGMLGPGARLIESATDRLIPSGTYPRTQGQRRYGASQEEIDLQNRFFNTVDQTGAYFNTYNKLLRADPSKAVQFQQANRDAVMRGQIATFMADRLKNINGAINQLELLPGVDEQKRTEALRNLHEAKLTLLKSFNDSLAPK